MTEEAIRVAVRIRPQIPRELIDMCRICTEVTPNEPQILLGSDKVFTFDHVFNITDNQVSVYSTCVEKLVDGALSGYNATILAYGQTGSGKTYTMGTGFERDTDESFQGIIPRAVRHIFSGIEELQKHPYENGQYLGALQFSVAAQFMELYNEDIVDLLDPYNKGKLYKIHEDANGSITVSGATIKPLSGPQDAINVLQQGALARTTASTNMNEQSSRSHALFTILIRRQRVLTMDECGSPEGDLETLTSKFHFVDLAGSERLKRTGATGERAREGISINCGLLALGNVISALGDKSKKISHVPYRDSKLTRLIQDSLGGNSQTVMIACVSPSDRDFMETLNTLKYANRARNIKNKVQINQDQSSRTISQLRREIASLQLEILEYKQGKRSIDAEGNSEINDTFLENSMLIADNKRLQQRLKAMQETINSLTDKNAELKAQKVISSWSEPNDKSVEELVGNYIGEIEKLKARLIESEQMFQQLNKTHCNAAKGNYSYIKETTENVINMAKRELEKERELLMSRSLPGLENESTENDSDSDSDSDSEMGELQNEINDISSNIEIKSKLIEQLEMSQKRMEIMKHQYEEKLNVLNTRILNTQKERDLVLANMTTSSTISSPLSEKVKKVKDEYERKLFEMQSEMKKLQKAQKEHIRQQRELQAQDAQLKTLRLELTELKQIKIKLMKKITEENNRHKEMESQKIKEIAQLRKEARKQVNMIRSLQAQGAAKDQVLKRKTEEVSNLRKHQRSMLSIKAAGRTNNKKTMHNPNPRHLKQKWDSVQRTITRAATSKQAVMELERELERLLDERNRLGKMLSDIKRRQCFGKTTELLSEEDSIKSNIQYVQYNIKEIQDSIIQIEEGKDTNTELQLLQTSINNIQTVEEAKYIIEKLCNTSIVELCETAISQARLKEKDQILYEVQQDNNIQQQLLQHIIAKTPVPNYSELTSNEFESDKNTDSDNTTETINAVVRSSSRCSSPSVQSSISKTPRMSRRTIQTTQELLYGGKDDDEANSMSTSSNQDDFTTSYREMIPLSRIPSAPGSLKGLQPAVPQLMRQTSSLSPYVARKNADSITYLSPRLSKKQYPVKTSSFPDDETPPNTPPLFRRSVSADKTIDNDNRLASCLDVFSRLGAGTQDPSPGGKIKEFSGKLKAGSPLICTHIVDGHNNSVLSVKATKDTLFTASADRTVKIWNLQSGMSTHCLSGHLGPVVAIEYDLKSDILFSASGAFIKMWDLRENSTKAIKTLCSSGSTLPGSASLSDLVPGECSITALVMGSSGKLYTAASEKVRVWDLRMLSSVAKLSGNHQAAVMCLTTWKGYNNTDYVATGSKDHYVKVFEVPSSATGSVMAIQNLDPPHYDGVQTLAVTQNDTRIDLFSGSRDSGIKQWDLQKGELRQSVNNSHNNKWISGMAIMKNILFSTCRGGLIRLWSAKTCEPIADMKTETSINDIFINDGCIYTASNDGKVSIYKISSSIRKLSR